MRKITIPLAMKDGAILDLEITPSEWGDHHSVTLVIPPELHGKVSLPRSLFSEDMQTKFVLILEMPIKVGDDSKSFGD